MNGAMRLGAALVLPLCLALLVSRIITLTPADNTETFAKTTPIRVPLVVTNQNLPELISMMPSTLHIHHIEWKDNIVSIDLAITAERAASASGYEDLFQVLTVCFHDTQNVNLVLLRMFNTEADNRSSFAAGLEAGRSEWKRAAKEQKPQTPLETKNWVLRNFYFTYSNDGKAWTK